VCARTSMWLGSAVSADEPLQVTTQHGSAVGSSTAARMVTVTVAAGDASPYSSCACCLHASRVAVRAFWRDGTAAGGGLSAAAGCCCVTGARMAVPQVLITPPRTSDDGRLRDENMERLLILSNWTMGWANAITHCWTRLLVSGDQPTSCMRSSQTIYERTDGIPRGDAHMGL
jgi:hypothetical protein